MLIINCPNTIKLETGTAQFKFILCLHEGLLKVFIEILPTLQNEKQKLSALEEYFSLSNI